MAVGSTIGSLLGGAAGSFVPGVGTAAGAAIGSGVGQLIDARSQKKKAESLTPSESPAERQLLNTIRRRRKALETGTADSSRTNLARQSATQAMKNAMQAGGGPVSSRYFTSMMNQASQNIADSSSQQYLNTLGLEQKQTTQMADAARDISLLQRNEALARRAGLEQAGNQAFQSGIYSVDTKKGKSFLELLKQQNQGINSKI
jgi:hypothetical protein